MVRAKRRINRLYFNLKNYSEAIKYFKLGYIISKDYVFKFYINYAEKCLNDAKNNQKIKKLKYVINLPNEDGEKLVDLLSTYLDSEIIDGKTANKLSDAINYCLQMNSFKLQSYATVLLFKYVEPLRSEILKDALISINLYDGIKAGILCFLVGEGYEGEISAVIGNIFKKKVIYKPHLNFENDIFSTAYALCISKAFASIDDLKIIRDTYEVVANVLYNYIGEVEFNDARSLSAVIYEYSNVAKIISRRDFIKFFDANQREIKKIENILSENGITIKNK